MPRALECRRSEGAEAGNTGKQGAKACFPQCHFLVVVLTSQMRNSLNVVDAARLRVGNQGSAQSVNFIKETSPLRHAALSKCISDLLCNHLKRLMNSQEFLS